MVGTNSQVTGVNSFVRDRNAPSDAMLMLGRSASGDADALFSLSGDLPEEVPAAEEAATAMWGIKLTSIVDRVKNPCVDRFSYDKEKSPEEEPTDNASWSTKLTSVVDKVKNPCADGLDTQCGDWRIEIKRENKDEGRDVEENDVKTSENPDERDAAEDKTSVREPVGDEGIRVTGIEDDNGMDDDGIKVTGMDAPSTEESEVETVVATEIEEASEETWVDRISNQAHNMCTTITDLASSAHTCTEQSKETISSFTSQTMDSIRNITAADPEDDAQEQAEEIRLANITEMALNGDQEDAYIAKEVIGQVKQIEHDKAFSIVEDAKKMMPQATKAMDKIASDTTKAMDKIASDAKPQAKIAMDAIASYAKSAWSFLSDKVASLKASCKESANDNVDDVEDKTVKTEAVTVARTIKTDAPTVAKTVKTEAATAKDETFPEETVAIPDDITTPGLVNDVSSLEESTA